MPITKAGVPFATRETSFQAADSVENTVAAIRRKIYRHIVAAGRYGVTCDELEVAFERIHETISARVWDLHGGNRELPTLIVDSGMRRPTRRGRSAIVWVAKGTETNMLATASRHSSESPEHYTPGDIVERARFALGGIDLDPASCAEAQSWIKAGAYYSSENGEDGWMKPWVGRVFLNPPGGMSDDQQRPVRPKCRETGSCGLPPGHTHSDVEASQKKWWFKLAFEYAAGRTTAAVFVCFSVELLQNTQVDTPPGLSIPLDHMICFPSRRIAYVRPGGGVGAQPPHASCVVGLGNEAFRARFREAFASLGRVVA